MQYKFFRKETGEWEKVEPEAWQWEAHYTDGETLKQFGDDGIFHQFKEIDQSRLAVFKMVSESEYSYTLLFEKGMKLIYFIRRTRLNATTPQELRLNTYCFGFKRRKGQRMFMITPKKELVITDNVDNVRIT